MRDPRCLASSSDQVLHESDHGQGPGKLVSFGSRGLYVGHRSWSAQHMVLNSEGATADEIDEDTLCGTQMGQKTIEGTRWTLE